MVKVIWLKVQAVWWVGPPMKPGISQRHVLVPLHVLALLTVLVDLVTGLVDVVTVGALVVALATIGVYCPERKDI